MLGFRCVKGAGGFGDKVVGLIAVKMIAELLEVPFFLVETPSANLQWKRYFDISGALGPRHESMSCKHMTFLDDFDGVRALLQLPLEQTILSEHALTMTTNMEIAQLFYKQLGRDRDAYINRILDHYRRFYTDYFVPQELFQTKIDRVVMRRKDQPLVGIQLRVGDAWMGVGDYRPISSEAMIRELLENVRGNIEAMLGERHKVFITSDFAGIEDVARRAFGYDRVIYYDKPIEHVDRTPNSSNQEKLYLDSIVLSQHTDLMFISGYSNFGRTAALSAHHDQIYDLQSHMQLRKEDLISKTPLQI